MSEPLEVQLKSALKCHLQQTGAYSSIKAFVASQVYAKMLNREGPAGYQPVELPMDDETQMFVFDMLMFMKQFGLEKTYQILMLEANIVISEEDMKAKSANSSMSYASPKRYSPERRQQQDQSKQDQAQIATQPKQQTIIADFDGLENEIKPKTEPKKLQEVKKEETKVRPISHGLNNSLSNSQEMNNKSVEEQLDQLTEKPAVKKIKTKKAKAEKKEPEFEDLDFMDEPKKEIKPKEDIKAKPKEDDFGMDMDNFGAEFDEKKDERRSQRPRKLKRRQNQNSKTSTSWTNPRKK
ncbi:Conserved_hypothetical protein [Hexamita inflata]|uniref:LisH domain-containing protein n=1 Tax=Hexamita inflata TaxID=28002 RepID=A0ABP1J8X7_9EUKA